MHRRMEPWRQEAREAAGQNPGKRGSDSRDIWIVKLRVFGRLIGCGVAGGLNQTRDLGFWFSPLRGLWCRDVRRRPLLQRCQLVVFLTFSWELLVYFDKRALSRVFLSSDSARKAFPESPPLISWVHPWSIDRALCQPSSPVEVQSSQAANSEDSPNHWLPKTNKQKTSTKCQNRALQSSPGILVSVASMPPFSSSRPIHPSCLSSRKYFYTQQSLYSPSLQLRRHSDQLNLLFMTAFERLPGLPPKNTSLSWYEINQYFFKYMVDWALFLSVK